MSPNQGKNDENAKCGTGSTCSMHVISFQSRGGKVDRTKVERKMINDVGFKGDKFEKKIAIFAHENIVEILNRNRLLISPVPKWKSKVERTSIAPPCTLRNRNLAVLRVRIRSLSHSAQVHLAAFSRYPSASRLSLIVDLSRLPAASSSVRKFSRKELVPENLPPAFPLTDPFDIANPKRPKLENP